MHMACIKTFLNLAGRKWLKEGIASSKPSSEYG
jgi:hypothetical protein